MKDFLLTVLLFLLFIGLSFAQAPQSGVQEAPPGPSSKMLEAQRVYRVFAHNETNPQIVRMRNDSLGQRGAIGRGGLFG